MKGVRRRPAQFLAAYAAAVVSATSGVHAQQQVCPTASKFGPNDQVGNLNHVTAAKTLAAAKLVTRGKAYRLGIETNKNTPAYPPRTFAITIVQPGQAAGGTIGPTKTTYNDDIIAGWVGIGSQLDGLGHVGIDNLYFNCNKAADFAMADGLTKLGIEHVPPIATRGVLLDMAGYFNTDIVREGTVFNRAEIEGALKRQGVTAIEPGDVVLFYTGWVKLLGKDNARYSSGEPGLSLEGARYLASLGVAMVGADTWAVEVVPFEKGAGTFEVHQILLPQNGIHILENMDTEEMVKDQAWEFLFTLGPARITGAVQAIINPIAIK
jgi:kynurenine formamidase